MTSKLRPILTRLSVNRLSIWSSCLILAALALAGCSNDVVDPPPDAGAPTSGVFRGELTTGRTSFEMVSNAAGDPNRPVPGPFLIRGSNLHYDDAAGALVVDLTVTNRSPHELSERVTLTFVTLLPDSVRVTNADNGETGPGALFAFDLVNDDGVWAPDEETLPRTVRLAVGRGVAVGFVARVDAGLLPGGGSIGGIVFEDVNENGQMDPDEAGLEDAVLLLTGEGLQPRRTESHSDGSYRFEDLPAGVYTVTKLAEDGLRPTTPTEIVVLLTEVDGTVSDFLAANFGCLVTSAQPPATVEEGDRVSVTGRYQPDPDRVVAREIGVGEPPHDDPGPVGPPGGPVDHPEGLGRLGVLAGPVTDVVAGTDSLAIMGTWVVFVADVDSLPPAAGGPGPLLDPDPDEDDCPALDVADVAIGDRVRARVRLPQDSGSDAALEGLRLRCWRGEPEKLRGVVQEVVRDADGKLSELVVLNTRVIVTADTHVEHDD